MAWYFLSVSSTESCAKGAMLVELNGDPDVATFLVDPDGEDVRDMEPNKFYTAEEMEKMGYESGLICEKCGDRLDNGSCEPCLGGKERT